MKNDKILRMFRKSLSSHDMKIKENLTNDNKVVVDGGGIGFAAVIIERGDLFAKVFIRRSEPGMFYIYPIRKRVRDLDIDEVIDTCDDMAFRIWQIFDNAEEGDEPTPIDRDSGMEAELDESELTSANVKKGRTVNEKDDSETETSWVKLEYNGSNPKIRAKCRKLYTDEQLAQHKLLSQEYIYDLIYYPDTLADRRKAEKEIIRRNLDVIKSEDWFSIGGPNYDRIISPDELDQYLDESSI